MLADGPPAGVHRANRGEDFAVLDALRDVAIGTCGQRPSDIFRRIRRREHEHAGLRGDPAEPLERFHAVEPVHRHVEEADVGRVLLPEPDCRLTVVGLGDHLEIGLGTQEVREACPHHRMVVDEQQADAGGEVHGGSGGLQRGRDDRRTA